MNHEQALCLSTVVAYEATEPELPDAGPTLPRKAGDILSANWSPT